MRRSRRSPPSRSLAALVPARALRPAGSSVTLTLDWTPNPDHVGFYYARDTGLFARGGPRRRDPCALRPDRAAQARRGRHERPRRLLRAGALLRRREEAARRRGRRSRPAAAQLVHRDRAAGPDRARSARGARSASPASRPTTRRSTPHSPRSASAARTSRSSPSATTCCPRCSLKGRRRARRVPQRRRDPARSCAASTRRSSRSTAPASPPTTSSCSLRTRTGLRADAAYRSTVRRFVAAFLAGTDDARGTPASRARRS